MGDTDENQKVEDQVDETRMFSVEGFEIQALEWVEDLLKEVGLRRNRGGQECGG